MSWRGYVWPQDDDARAVCVAATPDEALERAREAQRAGDCAGVCRVSAPLPTRADREDTCLDLWLRPQPGKYRRANALQIGVEITAWRAQRGC